METSLKNDTNVGLGFAAQSDPFQAGREAAQMAKMQLAGTSPDLVIALGPSNLNFQDYIEGVRLVTGEDMLIGVPSERIVSNELFSPHSCVVLLIRSSTIRFSLASSELNPNIPLASITSILSKLRASRGNTRHQYEHHGLVLFESLTEAVDAIIPQIIMAEAGLESWLVKVSPKQTQKRPLLCHDKILNSGLVALECLSNEPWGSGAVNIGAFKNHSKIYQEAVKSALRDAQTKMNEAKPSLGFLFFNFEAENLKPDNFQSIFKGAKTVVGDIPLVGMTATNPVIQHFNRIDAPENESIVALLMPG